MSEHLATIAWSTAVPTSRVPEGQILARARLDVRWWYERPSSASPSVVPLPWSSAAAVDPEEAFVASISSCHMLTFLFLAARKGFAPTSYRDAAVGVMTKNANGVAWVSKVTLHPELVWTGDKQPTSAELADLHHHAHEQCFIANSIKTEVVVAGI
jgi:organic hydroperoxide reductase OsmC/OhrA